MTRRTVARSKTSARRHPQKDAPRTRKSKRGSRSGADEVRAPSEPPRLPTIAEVRDEVAPIADRVVAELRRDARAPCVLNDALRAVADRLNAEADEVSPNVRHGRDRYLSALSNLMSGGLLVDDQQDGLKPETALIHVAGAQIKAVMSCLHLRGSFNETDWTLHNHEMTDAELAAALAGVVAVLQGSRVILNRLRASDEFRDSSHRPGGAS
jgi:hypothetical protein